MRTENCFWCDAALTDEHDARRGHCQHPTCIALQRHDEWITDGCPQRDDAFVGEAEFDAVFPWALAGHELLSPEEWDAGFAHLRPAGWEHADAGDYDAWVATLPRAIPLELGAAAGRGPGIAWPWLWLAACGSALVAAVWLL